MHDHKISINKKCPCVQQECPIRGNCVLCVQNHLVHKKHIPECMENILRPTVKQLAEVLEFGVSDKRPTQEFWKDFNKGKFLQETIEKHKK